MAEPHRTRRFTLNTFAGEAEFKRATHQAILAFDTLYSEILSPDFWSPLANQVREGGLIECFRPGYRGLDVTLRITKVDKGLVFVQLRGGFFDAKVEEEIKALRASGVKAPTAEEPGHTETPDEIKDDYKIGYAPNGGFYTVYKPSKAMIAQKLGTKQAAIDAALTHRITAQGPVGNAP